MSWRGRVFLHLSRVFLVAGLALVPVFFYVSAKAPTFVRCFAILATCAALILMSLICYCLTLGPDQP
jgi:hypothetical protein